MFPMENNFLKLLAYGKDKKQKNRIIKFTNHIQYNVLKKIAINILRGVIPLKTFQLKYLKHSKLFIRKLAEGKVKTSDLECYCTVISYIVKIAQEHNETHSKTSFSSHRKVGKNKRQQQQQRSCERSFSESTSSEESVTSQESNSSSEYPESEESGRKRQSQQINNTSDVSLSLSEEEI